MAEINDGKGVKPIAFYLPQFHAIPENDRAWGEGFTEWTNSKKAQPFFEGHYQPRIPLNNNYYNLLDDKVKLWQVTLAKEYGVFGFCYYHYWFKNGKKLLEKPAEQMLRNKEIDLPFCFSWANENWSKLWDGGNKELIAEQDYGEEDDWKKHLEYLVPFFKDDRYITLDGRPVFLIYKPEEIPKLKEMLDFWNREVTKYGISSICYMIQNPNWYFSPSYDMSAFDYQIKFHPFFALGYKGKNMKKLRMVQSVYRISKFLHMKQMFEFIWKKLKENRHKGSSMVQKRLNYDEMWEIVISSESSPNLIEGAFVDWDNSARKKNGYVHIGASPEKFEKYMYRLIDKVYSNSQQNIVFINAWNEWCEGAYLEPDEKYEFAYLEALKKALH